MLPYIEIVTSFSPLSSISIIDTGTTYLLVPLLLDIWTAARTVPLQLLPVHASGDLCWECLCGEIIGYKVYKISFWAIAKVTAPIYIPASVRWVPGEQPPVQHLKWSDFKTFAFLVAVYICSINVHFPEYTP